MKAVLFLSFILATLYCGAEAKCIVDDGAAVDLTIKEGELMTYEQTHTHQASENALMAFRRCVGGSPKDQCRKGILKAINKKILEEIKYN